MKPEIRFLYFKPSESPPPPSGRQEVFMVDFLKEHGFVGVLLMASYPNALFDMCGLCCGHFMMPMHQFLIATVGASII